jgi:hypothetical protein
VTPQTLQKSLNGIKFNLVLKISWRLISSIPTIKTDC